VADFENRLINKKCASEAKLNPESGLIAVVNFVTPCSESAQRAKPARTGTKMQNAAQEVVGSFFYWQPRLAISIAFDPTPAQGRPELRRGTATLRTNGIFPVR
jgi:hypothetical protein